MSRRRLFVAALAGTLSLGAVGACGSGSEGNDAASRPFAAVYADYLLGQANASESARVESDIIRAQQRAIVACMKEDGFSYIPVEPSQLVDMGSATDFTSIDYAKTRGFGLVANALDTGSDAPEDPNVKHVESLSKAEAEAWDLALRGTVTNNRTSCQAKSLKTARAELGIDRMEKAFDAADALTLADPRMTAADAAWATCAAKVGYPAQSRRALIDDFSRRLKPLVGTAATDDLRALGADEIKAAVATFPCSRRRQQVYARLHAEHERSR